METLLILLFTLLYYMTAKRVVVLAFRTSLPIFVKRGLIAFFLLLPFFDVLLGLIIYVYLSCFWCGTTVHETIEQPNGIYYQNSHMSEGGITPHSQKYAFRPNFDYVEIFVNSLNPSSVVKKSGLYRYYTQDGTVLRFIEIDEIESDIQLTNVRNSLYPLPLTTSTITISYTKTGKPVLTAKYAYLEYISIFGIPFFNWLNWHDYKSTKLTAGSKNDPMTLLIRN